MNSEDGQVYSVCILQFSCFTKYTRMQSKHKQTKCEQSRQDDIDFVTEFPCLFGHPVHTADAYNYKY